MTIQFHETVMGRRFIEGTMPALVKVLERIANVMEGAKEKKPRYRCSRCKGTNVQHAHWVNVNTDEVLDVFGTWNELDAVYCKDCKDNVPIEDNE